MNLLDNTASENLNKWNITSEDLEKWNVDLDVCSVFMNRLYINIEKFGLRHFDSWETDFHVQKTEKGIYLYESQIHFRMENCDEYCFVTEYKKCILWSEWNEERNLEIRKFLEEELERLKHMRKKLLRRRIEND